MPVLDFRAEATRLRERAGESQSPSENRMLLNMAAFYDSLSAGEDREQELPPKAANDASRESGR